MIPERRATVEQCRTCERLSTDIGADVCCDACWAEHPKTPWGEPACPTCGTALDGSCEILFQDCQDCWLAKEKQK